MKEISNQTLAFLLVLAVVISLGGTFLSLKKLDQLTRGSGLIGYATSSTLGAVNVSVSDTTQINFSAANISWGSGSVKPGQSNCTLNTRTANSFGCTGFNTVNSQLQIDNIGNNNVELNITFNKNKSAFIGGNSSLHKYMFKTSNGSTGGCLGQISYDNVFYEVNSSTGDVVNMNATVCTNLTYRPEAFQFNISINITIPFDAPVGQKDTLVTATAKSV